MATGFKIQGLDQFIHKMEDIADHAREDVQLAFDDFGKRVEQSAKQLVASNSSDEGGLLGAIGSEPGNLSVSIVAAKNYAAFIEFGTRKYAVAQVTTLPADWKTYAAQFKGGGNGNFNEFLLRIMGWIKRKGIPDSAAYPIARSILINGIRAKPFLYPSVIKETKLLMEDLQAALAA